MKSFLSSVLAVALSIQLCGASIDITADKRYPIIDALLTKAKTFNAMQLLIPTELIRNVWPQFIEYVANDPDLGLYQTEDFQGYTEAMQHFFEIAKQLDGDKTNCELLNMTVDALYQTEEFKCAKTFAKFYNIDADLEEKYKEIKAPLLTDTMALLTEAIESFQITLNAEERQEYSDFLLLCEKFLKTQNEVEKVFRFNEILLSLPLNGVKMLNKNCEWNPYLFTFFRKSLKKSLDGVMTPENMKMYEELKLQDEK